MGADNTVFIAARLQEQQCAVHTLQTQLETARHEAAAQRAAHQQAEQENAQQLLQLQQAMDANAKQLQQQARSHADELQVSGQHLQQATPMAACAPYKLHRSCVQSLKFKSPPALTHAPRLTPHCQDVQAALQRAQEAADAAADAEAQRYALLQAAKTQESAQHQQQLAKVRAGQPQPQYNPSTQE